MMGLLVQAGVGGRVSGSGSVVAVLAAIPVDGSVGVLLCTSDIGPRSPLCVCWLQLSAVSWTAALARIGRRPLCSVSEFVVQTPLGS